MKVKISVEKVIEALEAKLATIQKDKENEAENSEKYQKAMDKWRKQVAEIAVKQFSQVNNTNVNVRWDGSTNVDLYFNKGALKNLPAEPVREGNKMTDYEYKTSVEELESSLRILKMCEDEFVSASTMKSISKYL